MIPAWAQAAYLVAAICFILALKGLSSPRTARGGNLLGVAGALLAVVVTFLVADVANLGWIIAAVVVGAVPGVVIARRVVMTAMPQLVALFNGVGGAAAALVGLLEVAGTNVRGDLAAIAFTILVGAVSFSGSAVTFAKLQEIITTRPVLFPGGQYAAAVVLTAGVVLAGAVVFSGSSALAATLAGVGLVFGVLLVLPVGGADVPVVISLLNAFTGLAVAAGGYVLDNTLLLVAGTLVGASGTILTRLMAQAMGRSVPAILFGAFRAGSTAGAAGAAGTRPVRSAGPEDVAILLGYAHKVVIVPGYGLAVAQAQHTVHELAEVLQERGVAVSYAIHPVAGRMPGHMNVLLAEANVPYEQLHEMEVANPELRAADVALVVGANDVVNPAARTSPGSPIYGMPILDVDQAKAVVFLKRSMRPGFAGIENELLHDPRTTLLFGDAKESLMKLIAAVKNL
ncbi:MAG: NAD(P)(+) transhydrogenase (Re/Si-specific) subunit beta [Jiangellaceae bacterium]|nr:NAD(P)(+) transhydrogenase (Re/Si-specific) subunit beta [Jiangellaceae bacterium]